ncbi:MAG: hypothetical protein JRE36_05220 [Deltaproteobacteria bacterium]|nr:hypothetical protein [Deltaproteobacteria bacterium]
MIGVASCALRVTGYGLRVARCELRVAGYELRGTGCELRVTGCGFFDLGFGIEKIDRMTCEG